MYKSPRMRVAGGRSIRRMLVAYGAGLLVGLILGEAGRSGLGVRALMRCSGSACVDASMVMPCHCTAGMALGTGLVAGIPRNSGLRSPQGLTRDGAAAEEVAWLR